MVVLKLRKQTRPRRADPMRQPPTLVLLLSDNIMNIFLWMDVKVRDNACSDVSKEFYVATGWQVGGGGCLNDMYRLCQCVRNDQVIPKYWEMTSVSYTVSTLICNMYDTLYKW